ncbi:MAG: YeeE/YedE family protein, partial [Flavobacteriia bacterium]
MSQPLPWFIAGPLIGLIVPALLILREKQFGISSSYRFLGAVILPKLNYFSYNKDQDRWQFQFAIGLIL